MSATSDLMGLGLAPALATALTVRNPGIVTIFGGSANSLTGGASPFTIANSTFAEEGNIVRFVTATNASYANNADTTDDILYGIVIPAGAFDKAGRGLCITAAGITGATTNNKRFKMFINPTLSGATTSNGIITGGTVSAGTAVVDSGAWVNGTTPNNAAGWLVTANLFKYGVSGSNTQYVQGSPILGTSHGGINAPQFLTLTESSVINIVVTGSSYTTGAAGDVNLNFFEVNGMN